ncbi:MAG: transglycosylase domain-containing protein, partial [Myxococcota bacterium]
MFASLKQRPVWKRIAIIAGICVALLAVIGAVVYWLVVPEMAAKVVRERLAGVEERTSLKIDFDEVNTSGLSGVTITGIRVSDADGETLVTLAEASAGLDTGALLSGDRHISRIAVSGMELTVHRYADGQTNLEKTLARLRGGDSEDSKAPEGSDSDSPPGFLRPFGSEFPDVEASNARIVFIADDGAKPWAVDEISAEHFEVDSSGEAAEFGGTIQIVRGEGRSNWQLPETMKVSGELALPLKSSDLKLQFEKPFLVSGLPPEPMIRAGFSGLEIRDGGNIVVEGIDLALQGPTDATPLASLGRVEVSVNDFTTDLSKLRVLKVAVKDPVVRIDRSYQGGSGWNDLWELSRGQTARRVVGKAHGITRRIAVENDLDVEPRGSGSSVLARLDSVDWNDLLANRAPQSITVEGLTVSVTDERPLALLRPRRELSLANGTLALSHRALQGEISVEGAFDAKGEQGADLGRAEGDIDWSYRTGMLDMDVGLEGLHMGWLVQLSGRPIDSELRAGVMHVDLAAERKNRDSKLGFEGLFSLEDAAIHLEALTEEPITSLDTSYTFAGYYAPDAEIPEPELLRVRSYLVDEPAQPAAKEQQQDAADATADEEDEEPKPPRRGALVFTQGSGLLNGVKATFKPALYGLNAGQRPSRFDAEVDLPKTPVMDLFDAVPDAIKGPLVGTKMKGTFAWNFHVEVPLYEAGDMKWEANKNLQDFELVSMPQEVDVRRMRGEMTHTIVDERIEFERTIQLPEMRPVPLQWLVDNTDMPEEKFVERRMEREWPLRDPETGHWRISPRGDPFDGERESRAPADEQGLVGTPPDGERTPKKKAAEPKVMVKWKGKEKPHPYGRYRYVPLHHISPWLTRAVMTTEDNSFFDHGGFNWYALKESVEDNLDAGGFVRGASTVSMQLVKNLFLNRDKVIARKLREAFLVWIMEDVVDIPKSRILELYFNIIEFGPGIFGINDAAVHY